MSWQAHLGGFASGYVLGWVVPTGPFRNRQTAGVWQLLSLAGILLVLFCFYQLTVGG